MTATGSGSATSAIRSPPPARRTRRPARRRAAARSGRSASTLRGVNALETSRRSRVWSGGSTSSMPLRMSRQNGSWLRVGRPAELLVGGHVQVGTAEPAVAQQRVDVGVPGDQPLPVGSK